MKELVFLSMVEGYHLFTSLRTQGQSSAMTLSKEKLIRDSVQDKFFVRTHKNCVPNRFKSFNFVENGSEKR